MGKRHVICTLFAAAFVFGVIGVGTALAASKFLLNGGEVAATTSISMAPLAGTQFLLEDVGATQIIDLLCSAVFDGAVNMGGTTGSFTTMEMLNKEILKERVLEAEGDDIECEDAKKICTAPVLVVALGWVWLTTLKLATILSVSRYLLEFNEEPVTSKEVEFYVDCNTALGLVEDYCKGLTIAELKNEVTGVLAEFSENEEITPALNCTIGGAKKGLLVGSFLITEILGNTLSVSE